LDFPNKFEGKEADAKLLDKLTTDKELSGLLNVALKGLNRLLANDDFSYAVKPGEVAKKYIFAGDSVKAFVDDWCKLDFTYWEATATLYRVYSDFCEGGDLGMPVNEIAFGRRLKEVCGQRVKAIQHTDKGQSRVRGYRGIGLKKLTASDNSECAF